MDPLHCVTFVRIDLLQSHRPGATISERRLRAAHAPRAPRRGFASRTSVGSRARAVVDRGSLHREAEPDDAHPLVAVSAFPADAFRVHARAALPGCGCASKLGRPPPPTRRRRPSARARPGTRTASATRRSEPPAIPTTPSRRDPPPPRTPIRTIQPDPTPAIAPAARSRAALMGAIIGSQAGPIGAVGRWRRRRRSTAPSSATSRSAAGARLRRPQPSETERENEIDDQLERQASLEDEIQRELQRQEELLHQIDKEDGDARRQPQPASRRAPRTTSPRRRIRASAPPAPRAARTARLGLRREVRLDPERRRQGQALGRRAHASTPTATASPKRSATSTRRPAQLVRVEEDRDYDGRIDVVEHATRAACSSRASSTRTATASPTPGSATRTAA